MNAALTEGYEKDVGAKTTFQSLYSRIGTLYQKPNRLLVIPCALQEIKFAGLAPSIIDVHPCEVRVIIVSLIVY